MSNAPMIPEVKVPGLGTFTLSPAHVERTLPKAIAEKVGKATAIVRRFATLTTTTTEVVVDVDDDGNDVALLLESNRYSLKVDAPEKAKGLPNVAHVTAFGETKAVALAAFTGEPRKDGSPRVHVYGAVEYVRPSGATYVAAVRIAPSADGKTWRFASMLAQ